MQERVLVPRDIETFYGMYSMCSNYLHLGNIAFLRSSKIKQEVTLKPNPKPQLLRHHGECLRRVRVAYGYVSSYDARSQLAAMPS